MKNKILSYLFGVLLISSMFFVVGNVYADCDCPEGDDVCIQKCTYYESPDYQEKNTPEESCKGIKLNTNFPIIGNCIETGNGKTNATMAFPTMIGALTKIAMALVLIVCFILIIYAGILRAGAGEDSSKVKEAQKLLTKVAVTVLLLGFSGVILRLINPNFFGSWFI